LRQTVAAWRQAGETIALVPTMGALHDGHLALVRLAKTKADRAVVSIFVNPTQFAPHEDLARYPRDEAGDLAKLATAGADIAWIPTVPEMYRDGAATMIEPRGAALGLEGAFRPGHFAGVATVCMKLFNQVTPDLAIFGEKDFQQLAVIRQTVRDLDLKLDVLGMPTIREADNLALSSRNAYLSADERQIAPMLNKALVQATADIRSGMTAEAAEERARNTVLSSGFQKVDYIAARDAMTLGPYENGRPGRLLAAAWLGKTRLIDNIPL
jgi:pantoate--beta-alanine ligase